MAYFFLKQNICICISAHRYRNQRQTIYVYECMHIIDSFIYKYVRTWQIITIKCGKNAFAFQTITKKNIHLRIHSQSNLHTCTLSIQILHTNTQT